MICPKCKSEIKEDLKFCVNCGEALPQMKKCVGCEALIKESALFCTKCGTKQPQYNKENDIVSVTDDNKKFKSARSRKRLWGLIVVVTLVCLVFFCKEKGNEHEYDKINTIEVSNELEGEKNEDNDKFVIADNAVGQSTHTVKSYVIKEYLASRIKEIYSDNCNMEKYCSYEFYYLDSYAERLAVSKDMPLDYRDVDMWIDSQDCDSIFLEVEDISFVNECKANVKYKVIDSYFGLLSEIIATLIYDVDDWYVDDLYKIKSAKSEKQYTKEFIIKQGGILEVPRYEKYKFQGLIDEKYLIEMVLRIVEDQVSGTYHYTKTGSGTDLCLKGSLDEYGKCRLEEYDEKGNLTGNFSGSLSQDEFSGIFMNSKGKSMSFHCISNNK